MCNFLNIFNWVWFIWTVKYVLFWLYFWQLKDYHFGRFIDHFRTHKGKKLIFDFVQIAKVIILFLFLSASSWFDYLFLISLLIYLFELVVFLKGILLKSVKKPKFTFKILFLSIISFGVVVLFLLSNSPFNPMKLLAFDVLIPIIISIIVLVFQPFFVLLRNGKLRKARNKMRKVKSVSGLKVIAITGSYGKTSTKEFLTTILSKKFKVLSTKEHQNSEVGVANCILDELKPSHQIFIAEVGAYNKGKVKEVCSMVKPNFGIVTGVNEQHLALFGSLDNLLSAEGGRELATALPKDGILFVNGENKYCLKLYKNFNGNKKIYSLSNKIIDSDIWSDSVAINKNSISFLAIDKSGEMAHFDVKVLGGQNVQNLLGAILIAKELGMSFGEISKVCKDIIEEQAGMTIKLGKHGINIVDSSYSSNPDGVFADLDYLKILSGKKVIIMPCLIEIGKKSAEIHEKIGRKIGEICDLAIITSKDKFMEIRYGAMQAGMSERDIVLCDSPQDIYSMITIFCKSGDSILLEGRVPSKLINIIS